jgi:hypothetical protein
MTLSPADRFWYRVHQRALALTPDQARAFVRALDALVHQLSTRDVETLIAAGDVEGVIRLALSDANLDAAFSGFRAQLRLNVQNATAYFGKDIPGVAPGVIRGFFDVLSPYVVAGIRQLDTAVMQSVKDSVRETVRAAILSGFEQQQGPRTIAQGLRALLGLAPNQAEYVANLRTELETGKFAAAARRALLDKRFKLTKLADMPPAARAERIKTIVDAYRKSMIAHNAATVARTASVDAMKLGQRLAWQSAIDRGIVTADRLRRRYKGVMDARERPEHVALEGEVVAWGQPYSSGQMYPGEGDYNCRCLEIVSVARAASAA